jgi:hypothetical protein
MKVVFLDFDGVLNSEDWYTDRPHPNLMFNPMAIDLVNVIADRFAGDLAFVISSSWRILGRDPDRDERSSLNYCRGVLDGYRFHGRVFDATPTSGECGRAGKPLPGPERGHEIQRWLDGHPEVATYVIIDDSDDMVHLTPRLVRTEWKLGITEADVKRVIEMLDVPVLPSAS